MIFRILCLLSHSHAFSVVVIKWRVFGFEAIAEVITTSTYRQLSSGAGCPRFSSVFCMAYTLLTRPNQVETAVQSLHFWLLVWALPCRVSLNFSFLRSVSLAVVVFINVCSPWGRNVPRPDTIRVKYGDL